MRDYGRTARIHALQVLLLYASLFNCGLLTSQHSWRHPIIWLNGGQGKHGQFHRLWRCYAVLNCCLMADTTTFIPRNDSFSRIAPLLAWRLNFNGQSQGVRSRWRGRHDWLMASGKQTGRPWNYGTETPRQALLCILWRSATLAPLRTGCISVVLFDKSPKLLSIFNDAICGNMANMAIIIIHIRYSWYCKYTDSCCSNVLLILLAVISIFRITHTYFFTFHTLTVKANGMAGGWG